jgi:signal transduction histidine kinase
LIFAGGYMRKYQSKPVESKEAEFAKAREADYQKQLSNMKSGFLAELSHELRMPISVISGEKG